MKTAQSGRTILVAEDERPLARALELKLTKAGFKADITYDGEEALRAMSKKKFDLILLDLVMPHVDGFAVLERMKESKDKTPVIVLTNLSQREDAERALGLGAKELYVKSDTSIADVIGHMNKYLK